MTTTNLDLAPPVALVDGLVAVPIDIQRITASLIFDGATSSGSGEATLEFTMGKQDGNPVFDLRQTLIGAWLDGMAVSVNKLAHHDFGGGPYAEQRIIETLLTAGTTHSLRITYDLGLPQCMMGGAYPPAMTWSAGPRLAFNFGLSDLNTSRYLEAWIPANLIFDQFELILELRILNTPIVHTPITNGTVTSLGFNYWIVSFPSRYTALSPLLELRASDTLESMTGTVVLPISGTLVTIEAWKLATDTVNLADQIAHLQAWLPANESSLGTYMHGNRFVAFIHVGGMEYEGGTTTSSSALRHETFHSWWARGLKPASQPDGWLDEAWATYYDHGASASLPFDFSAPVVKLCSRNPWVRQTAGTSYQDGNRFWEGMAALLGVANLKDWMNIFYAERRQRPVSTLELEEYLLCKSGKPQLVDAFHRFIYGFGDPSPVSDVWLRDDPGHAGSDAWAGRFWDSPDLWVRNADDGIPAHQNPISGQDNWLYARVRNRSISATCQHFVVSFNERSFAGTEFLYPSDFLPCIAAAAGFALGPGQTQIVKARWPADLIPSAGTHACLLAAVFTRLDHPIAGRHVWEHNNLAQKNLTIVDLAAGEWVLVTFVVGNLRARAARSFMLELIRPAGRTDLRASLIGHSPSVFRLAPSELYLLPAAQPELPSSEATILLDCGGAIGESGRERGVDLGEVTTSGRPAGLTTRFAGAVETVFANGPTVQIPVSLRRQEQQVFGLRLHAPEDAQPGEVLRLDLLNAISRLIAFLVASRLRSTSSSLYKIQIPHPNLVEGSTVESKEYPI